MRENSQSELLESLSALADGEATEFEIRRILKDEENASLIEENWSNYQRVGSLLRKESIAGVDISAAVKSAIEEERLPSQANRFFKPLSQFAVAASVAGLALFGVNQYQLAQIQESASGEAIAEVEEQKLPEEFDFAPPIGFEVAPQTSLVSTSPEVSNISERARAEASFDEAALYEHINQSILQHSEDSSESTQDIYLMLRAPVEE